MAQFESDSVTKKSSKFENFLKRTLDEDSFARVRAYEACIVCSHKESKAFKYVVLSDECLYLTENPPKSISVAVNLEDIFGIELVDDLPDFLSGQEQRNTTHIEINYWAGVETKKSSSRPSSRESKRAGKTSLRKGSTYSSTEEQAFLSAAAQSLTASDDEQDSHSTKSMSKSMPESSLKSIFKGSNHNKSSQSLKSSGAGKKVTITLSESASNQSTGGSKHRELPPGPTGDGSLSVNSRSRHGSSSPSSKLDNKSRSESSLSNHSTDLASDNPDDSKQWRRLTLHLYMLIPDSKMVLLIRSAVNNHLIKSTLMMDIEHATRMMSTSTKGRNTQDAGGKLFSERIDMLFAGLAKDIMDTQNTMERQFELIQELYNATDKYFHLKRLFWKSGELFAMFISILKTYLPNSPINVNCNAGRARRADEFELIILVIQTLGLMFRETEVFPSRLRVLKQNAGKHVIDLVTVLTCLPELPTKYVPPTTKASKLLMQTEADQWKCLADVELHDLFVEYTTSSTSVLFEVLVIAQQSNWGRSETSFFSVTWLMNILEKLDTTERFLERLIGQAMRYIQPSKRERLTAPEAILVFEEFYILHAVINYSPRLAAFIRNNYTEEFKYYIQGPVLRDKLPEEYPISSRTILLIEEVMSEVLQKKTKLLSAKRYID